MPDISATLTAVTRPEEGIVNGTAGTVQTTITATAENSATLTAQTEKLTGTLTAVSDMNIATIGVSVPTANGEMQSALSIRQGIDGQDGFTPTISVKENSDTAYVLTITNRDGSFDTPNLYYEPPVLDLKVDKDLTGYTTLDATSMTYSDRELSTLYVDRNGEPSRIKLSDIALEEETNTKIRLKLRSVEERPNDWRKGDFIFNNGRR